MVAGRDTAGLRPVRVPDGCGRAARESDVVPVHGAFYEQGDRAGSCHMGGAADAPGDWLAGTGYPKP